MRRNNFLILILIWLTILVLAAAPDWIDGASDVNYTAVEGLIYYHNFSANITNFSNDVNFSIDTATDISWTNSSGVYSVSASQVSSWISIIDVQSGNFSINATYNNQTGFFVIPIQATNVSGGAIIEDFEFIINATNDAPNFSLNSNYNVSIPSSGSTVKNISLTGTDEELQHPLRYNVSFLNCSFSSWSSRNNSNCSLNYEIVNLSNVSSILALSNLTHNDIGTYNLTICVSDNINGSVLPAFYDSSYIGNKSYCQNTTLILLSSLSINVSNCTGVTVMENNQFNCTINITTRDANNNLNISSYAFFTSNPQMTYNQSNRNWFYVNASNSSSDYFYSVPISITPDKNEVGNWTINFSVSDNLGNSTVGQIGIYVNFTESNVALNSIGNYSLYEDSNFDIFAVDEDLLIWDSSVKDEILNFSSNVSWVSVGSGVSVSGTNYSTASVSVDYGQSGGVGNYSVNISVIDSAGNSDYEIFNIEILTAVAPQWNSTLDDPVLLSLIEGVLFSYNVSANVSDVENDSIVFYYQNVSASFCSLNGSTFNSSSGIISFIPRDCDVGYHNITILASDGKINSSKQFNFSVSNVPDTPSIYSFTGRNVTGQSNLIAGFNFIIGEGVYSNFSLVIDDDDFLIPSGQRANYYNESLIVDVVVTNSTGSSVNLFEFSFVQFGNPNAKSASYNATFRPNISQVDNYTIFVNVSDISGNLTNRTFYLNVSESLDVPVLSLVGNLSLTINDNVDFNVSASDDEDDYGGVSLSYSIVAVDVSAPNLTIGNNTGRVQFAMSSNQSYAGIWEYNISVSDSDEMVDWQLFYLSVYGNSSLISPSQNVVFNLTENVMGTLNFSVNHSVGDNLSYEFWVDSISCNYQNNSDCSYGSSVVKNRVNSFGNTSVVRWSFTPNYTDETYGNYKNLTVRVYPNGSSLNSSQRNSVASNFSFKLNVSHANSPPVLYSSIGGYSGPYSGAINVNLSSYFRDYDYSDSYYLENVTFNITSDSGTSSELYAEGTATGNQLPWSGLISDWFLQFYALRALTESITIVASDSSSNVSTAPFSVEFTEPTSSTTPSSSSSSSSTTTLKYYSLKIIVPQDVIISDENFIEVPFSLQNTGATDLTGIKLTSQILYNDVVSEDVKILLESSYISSLKIGQKQDYVMKISTDTHRAGKYKATIFADVSSPKFSDWGDFFIELRNINESDAEKLLVFTEKLVSENPECLEFTELFNRAQNAFDSGDTATALKLAQEVSEACENAIVANEQIRHKAEGFIDNNFYYILFVAVLIFFTGFIFYVYKRTRFNKYKGDEIIGDNGKSGKIGER